MSHSLLQHERIHKVDAIRGFAILGIFLVNIPDMLGNSSYHIHHWIGTEKYVRLFYDLFVQTKFYTIFSFLFGLGFYIFISRAEAKGLRYNTLFLKRLFFLFIFGAIHYIFFWHGDILHAYAIGGLFLLLFYRCQLKTILGWAIACFIVANTFLLHSMVSTIATLPERPAPPNYFFEWATHVQQRASNLFSTQILGQLMFLPEILALFLVGLYVGKKGIFANIDTYKASIRKWQIGSLIVGLSLSIPIVSGFLQHDVYIAKDYYLWYLLSGKALAVFYITTLMLAKGLWLRYMGYVGQMALSNYITHTLIGVVLLSGVLNQVGNVSLLAQIGIVIFVYLLQIFVSKWWLTRYRFGPLEWLWRSGTYGKVQSMKREHVAEK